LAQSPQELQNEIRRRDALINALIKRVESLEKEMHVQSVKHPAEAAAPLAGPPPAAAPSPSVVPATATPRVSPPPSDEEVEANVARALENTLVDQGGLLLSPWSVQIVPDFNFTHQSLDQLSFVAPNLLPAGVGNPVTQRFTRNLFEWGLGLRLGLPWDSQVSIRLPVDLDYGSATFGGVSNVSQNRGGIGDFSINLQKQIFHEKGLIPDVLLNVGYKADTGSTSLATRQVSTFPFSTGTGSGFNSIFGGVTLLKRQDPLVFLGAFSYSHNFASTIDGASQTIGDSYGTRLLAILASSPDTSLRIGWDTVFEQDSTVNGRTVPGSNQQISFMEFGVGSVLSARWFLDAQVNIGLTRDTPDYTFEISFPYRF
jgi:hypothetical protein